MTNLLCQIKHSNVRMCQNNYKRITMKWDGKSIIPELLISYESYSFFFTFLYLVSTTPSSKYFMQKIN